MSTEPDRNAWLLTLKAGDTVVVMPGAGVAEYLAAVTRVTPTQIVVNKITRFARDTGRERGRGDSYSQGSVLAPATVERLDFHARRSIRRALGATNWHKVSDAAVEKVWSIVQEGKA